MIEVRPFAETAHEAAAFMREVWRGDYAGNISVPFWDEQFLTWQLFGDQPGQADYRLAAYDGGRLVGTYFARLHRFSLHGREVEGSMASWLTVHPDYRRKMVGPRLVGSMCRQHEADGRAFLIGFAYRNPKALGFQFWEGMRQATPERVALLGPVNFWARVLDPRRVARWSPHWYERLAARLVSAVQGRPSHHSGIGCRPFEQADLAQCLVILESSQRRYDLTVIRGPADLQRQLQFEGVARTLVAETKGRITGLLNYYRLELLGHGELTVGFSDLLFVEGPGGERLLRASLASMAGDGLALALVPGFAAHPRLLFFRAGFVPLPPEHNAVCLKARSEFSMGNVRRIALPVQ
jgi:GNAT superfamily N-acetyltransferase